MKPAKLLKLAACFGFLFQLSTARGEPAIVVRGSGLENVFVMAPIYVMKEQKFDLANGVDFQLKMYANIEAVYQAMRAGDSEMGPGGWTNALQWRATGSPWTVVYPIALGAGVDVLVPPGSSIKSLSDLKGKKVASYAGPTGTATMLLRTLLADYYGFDPAKTSDLQYGSPPVLINALKRGEIDALVLLDPLASKLMGNGEARSISNLVDDYQAKSGKKMLWLGWLVHEKLLQRSPEAVTRVLTAYRQALDYLDKHPDEWKRYAKPSGIDDAGLELLIKRTKHDLSADWNQGVIDDLEAFAPHASSILGTDIFPAKVPEGTFSLKYAPKP
ncbi:ABC transporter substrate-binding protein [Bradyrhizobium canariense]|uniref:ABC-type nitrate/sulfonate/bicarbonate transport system, substrate-binding protein n=1 Tax=Bradyrhizobium canariense TaxID=255045 RepID=A0A1H1XPQ0_9BRAD|nr:ABC transporter substrate-binding protein [Bradyrhizobium canariense]SDT11112.1 ABC-type nitrate/sulfonate/bicarbonate transport system, substrate-binding protein [Bradyrhizobium canariense]